MMEGKVLKAASAAPNIADSIEVLGSMLQSIHGRLAQIDTELADETRYSTKDQCQIKGPEVGPGTLADIQGMIELAEDISSFVNAIDRKLGRSQRRLVPCTPSSNPLMSSGHGGHRI